MRNDIAADTKINFRVTPEERRDIEDRAKVKGLSTADYCRRKAMGKRT